LRAHRETYRNFWRWSDAAIDHAMLTGSLHTVFGWQVHVDENPNPRSLRNFPMQANGAEMLRLACCLATERDIEVCAPVHDAVLICAPLDRLERLHFGRSSPTQSLDYLVAYLSRKQVALATTCAQVAYASPVAFA
jgi:hypothetical protein